MKNKMRITALLLSGVLLCPQWAVFSAQMPDSFENILENPGFEMADSCGFPIGWESDGKNLIPNGDFEGNSLSSGYNLANNKAMKYTKAGGAEKVEVCENKDAPSVLGAYSLKATWGEELKWGGAHVQDDTYGLIPLSYGSSYIMRAFVKSGDNSHFTAAKDRFQFNLVTNYKKITSNDNVVDDSSWIPTTEWKEYSKVFTVPDRTTLAEAANSPYVRRYQVRTGNARVAGAELYVDNFSMEKLSRCDEAEKKSGNKALKIVAYDDGLDEVWTSKASGGIRQGREIVFGASSKGTADAHIRLVYYNMYGDRIVSDEKEIKKSDSWQDYLFSSTVPDDAESVSLELAVKDKSGTVWFDDCFIGKRNEAANQQEERYSTWFNANYSALYKGEEHIKAAVAARFYRYYKKDKYLTNAVTSYKTMMAMWQADKSKIAELADDFFSGNYIVETYMMMKKLGYTTPEEEVLMLEYLDDFVRFGLMESHNQISARAVAIAYAVKVFPDYENTPLWQQWLDNYWAVLDNDHDFQEDAGDYNAIMMRDVIRWLEVAGMEEELLEDGWRDMFKRYLYQLAPNGSMPEYGDDFYGRTLDWIYIFEYLADLYNDAEFAYGARKAFDWGVKNAPSGKVMTTETLELLPRLYGGEVKKSEIGSMISKRRLTGGEEVMNKILLRNEKGYVWIENTYNLSHSHVNAKGAVTYYEYDNVPLFHSFERRYTDPRFQQRPAILPADEPFPFNGVMGVQMNPGRARTGIWYHDELNLKTLPPATYENLNLRDIDQLCLRLSRERENHVTVTVDNIRLEGPAGVKMIYDFEDGSKGKFTSKKCKVTDGGYESNKAMSVRVDTDTVFYNAKISERFDITEYDTLKWDWKTATDDNKTETGLWFIMRVSDYDCIKELAKDAFVSGNGTCYIQMQPGEVDTYGAKITDAKVCDRDGDSFAEIEISDFFLPGNVQKRRILLTKEGYLITADTLYPAEEADGYRAGAIWGLYNIEEKGNNWFLQKGEKLWYDGMSDSKGKTNGMFVKFSDKNNRLDSVSVAPNAQTQSASRIIKAGQSESFITVVAPNINDERSGNELNETVKIHYDLPDSSGVSYQTPEGFVHIEFPEGGGFKVTRENEYAYSPELLTDGENVILKSIVYGDERPALAFYKDNALIKVVTDIEKTDMGAFGEYNITAKADGADLVKAFVWDAMKPMSCTELEID